MLNLEDFINTYVTKRQISMFQVDIDNHISELQTNIEGKAILVIGGAGSIGSSFIRAVLQYRPSELVVVDTNENALTELTRDLRSSNIFMPEIYRPYPMDYNSMTFERMFREHNGFDIIANFSAHKHVRSERDIYSIEALIRNNVINAKKLLNLLKDFPPQIYFCVSTDKAADPVNIMGASKRLMEDLIFSYSQYFPVKTARFANVAFSNGSLPAGFLDRLSKFQPISAPLNVKRYFVSPVESGQICMLAAVLGNNREIFFPKLTEEQMMSFDKIAEELLKAYGYEIAYCKTDEDAVKKSVGLKDGSRVYPVHFSEADTSGEKMFEEFYTSSETIDIDRFNSLGVIVEKKATDYNVIEEVINNLDSAFDIPSITKRDIVKIIASYLPNFGHIETGKSLDEKM